MKTTIDMADDTYRRLRRIADKEHTTMRSLIEEGLREVLPRHEHHEQFTFKPVVAQGSGLCKDFAGADWAAVRAAAYEGRGT
jgi:hypothetical protein